MRQNSRKCQLTDINEPNPIAIDAMVLVIFYVDYINFKRKPSVIFVCVCIDAITENNNRNV